MRASLLTSPCVSMLCVLALMGCDEPTPTPVDLQNNGTAGPEPIDFTEIVGQNAADPNTSPLCPLGVTCAPLPGEPVEALVSGTCEESHFDVMSDGTRAFVDEVTRTHLTRGRLASLQSDRGDYTISYTGTRIETLSFEPAPRASGAMDVTFDYTLSRLIASSTLQGDTVVEEKSFTYDMQNRTATAFTKTLQGDGSFERRSLVYNYTGERAREIWEDLDVDGTLSDPDELSVSTSWRADGLLDTITNVEGGEPTSTLTYSYDADGLLTGITRSSMETTLSERTFIYDEEGRLQGIDFGEGGVDLALTRDAQQRVTRAQILDAAARVLYEIEMSGTSCDRPINTWIGLVEQVTAPAPQD